MTRLEYFSETKKERGGVVTKREPGDDNDICDHTPTYIVVSGQPGYCGCLAMLFDHIQHSLSISLCN